MEEALQTPASTRKWTLLVVEDETLIRSMVSDYLRDADFTVIEAKNADEAITVISSSTPVDMPGDMDGLMLASWIHRYDPNVPVIVTSGVAELRDDYRGMRVLQKPYSPRVLERKIRELLGASARTPR
jgi:DNA-binding response OmpR family regulator